jgi:serine O-acetyltransferase
LGDIIIGADTRIGANAVVVKSVPANSVVVGIPGQNIARSKPRHATDLPDLNHSSLPDLVGVSLSDLMVRVEALEKQVDGKEAGKPHIHAPENGTWHGEDFSI